MTQAGWDDFGGRFVVLITDAGPNPAQESTIAERADAATLSALAREQGIAIYTMHLRTAAGAGTHDFAEGQYRELSRALGSDAGDRYHPIEGGSPEALGENVAQLASSMVESVRQAMDGRVAEALEAAEDDLAETAALDTLAMQLAYLGRLQDERAPDVFKAWIADRALENTTQTAVEVRLLITKNQLNTLRDVLREIVDAGEATRTDSAAFFDQVRGALAAMARGDEERLVNAQFDTLGGALGEFLDGLPYRSPLLELTPERWLNTSSVEQRVILDRLRSRLRLFERVHDDPANWTALYEDAPPGETVYAMPLSVLALGAHAAVPMRLVLEQVRKRRAADDRVFELTIEHLALGPGERLAVVGQSGSGKSTLLDIVGLALAPDGASAFRLEPTARPRRMWASCGASATWRLWQACARAISAMSCRAAPCCRSSRSGTTSTCRSRSPAGAIASACATCSTGWASPASSACCPSGSRSASASGSRSRVRSRTGRTSCSPTSRPPRSTRTTRAGSWRPCSS